MDNWQELVSQLKDILPEESDKRILLALKQNEYDLERAAEALMTGNIVEEIDRNKSDNNIDKTKLNPKNNNGRSKSQERKKSDPKSQRQNTR
jgi:hypothetical protein